MATATQREYRSIFTDRTAAERRQNFDDYLAYTCTHGGELLGGFLSPVWLDDAPVAVGFRCGL